MQRNISWEYWENPFGGGKEWTEEGVPRKKKKKREYEDFDESVPVRPVVMTDAGMMPLAVYGDMTEVFDFWIGNTDFNLSRPVCKKIREVEGVETLDILTRYRFRISFGKMFKSADVKLNINKVINNLEV